MNNIFANPAMRENYRYVAHSFIDKRYAPPLQSADLLAWLSRNAIMKMEAGAKMPRADFLALIRKKGAFRYYDRFMLDAIRRDISGC